MVPMADPDDLVPIDPDLGATEPGRFRPRVDVLAVIAAGGMLGASARYTMARWLPTRAGHFPWATFWTNVSGSFVLGFLLIVLIERFPPTRYVRPFLTTGIIGAFTTMSTYEVETALLVKDSHQLTGIVYGVGSLVVGIGFAALGIVAGRRAGGEAQRA
jgi:CrcB protein